MESLYLLNIVFASLLACQGVAESLHQGYREDAHGRSPFDILFPDVLGQESSKESQEVKGNTELDDLNDIFQQPAFQVSVSKKQESNDQENELDRKAMRALVEALVSSDAETSENKTTADDDRYKRAVAGSQSSSSSSTGNGCGGAGSQASSKSFTISLPGGIVVAAAFSEASSNAGRPGFGSGSKSDAQSVAVTGPDGTTYTIRGPGQVKYTVAGPQGTKYTIYTPNGVFNYDAVVFPDE